MIYRIILTCTHIRFRKFGFKFPVYFKEMSTLSFVQNLNPISNKMEWKIVDDDYDYNQEIAISCYGDMLHDSERNKKFGEALKIAIKKWHSVGKKAHVLDIGTGTGLLSMLAVKFGADTVCACEAFLPIANCAVNIIKENDMDNKIKIIKSHSTSLTVGENGDLKQKANILVSEVFDTELIGEGAINTFNHALENLITEDCIVIPSSGTVYAQVIESERAQNWNQLKDWKSENKTWVKVPEEIKTCPGTGAVHDIQLSEFNAKHFKALSTVIPIFKFDWAKNKKIPTLQQKKSIVKAIASGKAQVIFMWWDLNMDEEGKLVLSCAPVWEHPESKGKDLDIKSLTKILPWRDHWMQAVYFLSSESFVEKDETFVMLSNHDEFSFWFQLDKIDNQTSEALRPICTCAFHFLLSRSRIGAINEESRRNLYFKTLRKSVTSNTVCIVLGDVSLLGHLCAKFGAKKVYILSENSYLESVYNSLTIENDLTDIIAVKSDISQIAKSVEQELGDESFDILILSEPYFRNSILPWDNMAFWYAKEELSKTLKYFKQVRSVSVVPTKCKLKGCAVQLDNLWKIATPLNNCEGFSMKLFDNLIHAAKSNAEKYIEVQPLWEYPGLALSLPITFFEYEIICEIPKEKFKNLGKISLEHQGKCDGVALWMEYDLGSDCTISFGPVEEVLVGQYITWNMFEKQGIHLFRIQPIVKKGDSILYIAEFDPNEAEVNFHFNVTHM